MTDDIVEKFLNKYKNYPANHYIKLYIKQVDTPRATVTAGFEETEARLRKVRGPRPPDGITGQVGPTRL